MKSEKQSEREHMRKSGRAFVLWFLLISGVVTYAAVTNPYQKKYKFEFTEPEVNMILTGLEQSDMSHKMVITLQQNIITQFNAQQPQKDSIPK